MRLLIQRFTQALVLSALIGGSGLALAQDKTTRDSTAAPGDNTKVNKRDRNKSEPTADQQKMNKSDREITRDIRRAIVNDKSLSTYAHNVKVITQNGSVTLKGPVRTEEDKTAIEAKAAEVAGANNVKSEISIVPKGDTGSRARKEKDQS
jgi:hyperosmotically inducible periplasmic protein